MQRRWAVALTGLVVLGIPAFSAISRADDATSGTDTEQSTVTSNAEESKGFLQNLWANYYGIYYGSSVTDFNAYQSGPNQQVDQTRPVFLKNFLTLGYNLGDNWAIAGTGFFTYVPGNDEQATMRDPSARIACNSILNFEGFNWYGDARVHFPITMASRMNDMLVGFQTFHYFSYQHPGSRLTMGLYASARYNYFGSYGSGDDVEFYAAPALNYDLSPKVALTAMYEMGADHGFGDDPGVLSNQGTDFEPGVLWRITSNLEFNPYLNFYTGGSISLATTSLGATLSWMML